MRAAVGLGAVCLRLWSSLDASSRDALRWLFGSCSAQLCHPKSGMVLVFQGKYELFRLAPRIMQAAGLLPRRTNLRLSLVNIQC